MRPLQALGALLWGVPLSYARSRGLTLLLLSQAVLWAAFARKAALSPPDGFSSSRAVSDIATVAMWVVCVTGNLAAFRVRSLLRPVLASPASRGPVALSMVLPGTLLAALFGFLPVCIGLPEAVPGALPPLVLMAFAVSGTTVGLMLAMPSRDSFLAAGFLWALLLVCSALTALFSPIDLIAFGFLRRHVQSTAWGYDYYILIAYTVCLCGWVAHRLGRSLSPVD
ncbi:MAG: hypothetical protein IT210_23275 [Armatimonadetes bacterium]|nr:hypothetical protein [Armatimonadota bacterium]